MGRFYGLPVWGYAGHSDSKVVDGQAAADAQFAVLVAFLCKTNLNHDVGYLESGLCASPALMAFADEIIDQVRFLLQGFEVSDAANLVDDIRTVGPGGSFLEQDSTLERYREAIWSGGIIDQGTHEEWEHSGGTTAGERARERALKLLAEHKPRQMNGDRLEAMWRIARGG